MDDNRWSRIERIYHAALERTVDERAAFVTQACSSDSDLRREVESLLAYHSRGDKLLDPSGMRYAAIGIEGLNIQPGTSMGPYEIQARIGTGGMGEVYKARDVRLNRIVAIKVLPQALDSGLDSKSRFEREAKAIATLNHPHICALFDVGEMDGIKYLVMEHLDGETLAERLRHGGLPLEQAMRIALQVLEALNHAHLHGIIHRDLKPANIMITAGGAKLLDFGLAKLVYRAGAPVRESTVTAQGAIVGTLPYMSPEQLEGKEIDERTDIYAFGSVLYEILTGKRAFRGETQAALISAIMSSQPPPLHVVQPALSVALDHVVENCLAKNPAARWQTVADVLLELKWVSAQETPAPGPAAGAQRNNRAILLWGLLAVVVVCAAAFASFRLGAARAFRADRPVQLSIPLPQDVISGWLDLLAISPDGHKLVFDGPSKDGRHLLWVRELDSLHTRPLPGVEGYSPFWTPDSRSIAFFSVTGKLQKVDAGGGTPVTLCDAPSDSMGTFGGNGVIVFAGGVTGELFSVPVEGGGIRVIMRPDKSKGERSFQCPSFLGDGRRFLYFSRNQDLRKMGIYAATLDGNNSQFVMPSASCAIYAPPGYILFLRDDALVAQRFDTASLRVSGDAFTLAEAFGSTYAASTTLFSVSSNGLLAYRGWDAPEVELNWYSRSGIRLQTVGERGRYRQVALSPDGTKVSLERLDTRLNTWDLWLLDLRTNVLSRFTEDPGDDTDAVWAPDSREIVFASDRVGLPDLFRKPLGAAQEQLLYADPEKKVPESWTKSGAIVYTTQFSKMHLLTLSSKVKPVALFQNAYEIDEPHVSPDGHWIAYGSVESGGWNVYVASFPTFEEKHQLSSGGGSQPLWRGDSKELYYVSPDGKIMSVEIKPGATLQTGAPKILFESRLRPDPLLDQYGVTNDGQRFLVAEPLQLAPKPITVVLNWSSLLHVEASR
jgi:eukaryotic-like serine/threonine-protein kinase